MGRKAIYEVKTQDLFDDLLVVKDVSDNPSKAKKYLTECQICHRKKIVSKYCLLNHKGTTHKACGQFIKNTKAPFYHKWQAMRQRTTNPNTEHYSCYGGRGIKSDAFKYFIDFYDAMYDSYLKAIEKYGSENLVSLDRIDVNGDYCPENCRWISLEEQKCNMRKNRLFLAISPDGTEYIDNNQSHFARTHRLSDKQINACLMGRFATHFGWKFQYIEKCNDYPNAINEMALGVWPTDSVGGREPLK